MLGDDREDFPGRLLHQAALWDNAELLDDLLASDQVAHINSRDSWGRTALHAATTTNGSRCLRVLLQAGADPNIACGLRGDHKTALHLAAEHGYLSNVSLLVSHGADLQSRDHCGMTPSDLAERGEHTDCLRLLRHTADLRERERLTQHARLREACSAGDAARVRSILKELGRDATAVVNMTPDGSNTLLYRASSDGMRSVVRALIECGAEGRQQPVTRYSPLYIAAYCGHRDVVLALLKSFPELISALTVERWSPIHACCIAGRSSILQLLLQHSYPAELLADYTDPSGQFSYRLPFNINARDMEGQTPLYQASCVGNRRLVEILVQYRVRASKVEAEVAVEVPIPVTLHPSSVQLAATTDEPNSDVTSSSNDVITEDRPAVAPVKRRISDGIQALMSRLNLGRGESTQDGPGWCRGRAGVLDTSSSSSQEIMPLDLNVYCNNNAETALHAAVRHGHHGVVSVLLKAGADPNLSMYLSGEDSVSTHQHPHQQDGAGRDRNLVFTGSSALVEACRNVDLAMIDLLLEHGARDHHNKALYVACRQAHAGIISRFLALKAHADPDYKVQDIDGVDCSDTYLPVMVNWHAPRCLQHLRPVWLVEAAHKVNAKLGLCRQPELALAVITRLDVSNNAICELPSAVFRLRSLRHLSVAQNKLERLLSEADEKVSPILPVLEELHLQENRLQCLPDFVFTLPSLSRLDVSNNKLTSLPAALWSSPSLIELNASLNMLHSLPPGEGVVADLDDTPGSVPRSSAQLCAAGCRSKQWSSGGERGIRTPVKMRSLTGQKEVLSHDRVRCLRAGRKLRSASEDRSRARPCSLSTISRPRSQSRRRQLRPGHSAGLLSAVEIDISATAAAGGSDGIHASGGPDSAEDGLLQRAQIGSSAKRFIEIDRHSYWRGRVDVNDLDSADSSLLNTTKSGSVSSLASSLSTQTTRSRLQTLNLAHNQFGSSPSGLACVAVSLVRLNLSYNSLCDLGHVTNYPACLRHLDVSHNRISAWPLSTHQCRSQSMSGSSGSGGGQRLKTAPGPDDGDCDCRVHCRRCSHDRFESLRTLILSDNLLTTIQLTAVDQRLCQLTGKMATTTSTCSGCCAESEPDQARLLFPQLSVLDVSNNCLQHIPADIHQLSTLSVLNISGNTGIVELPPQIGLLSRLWNLNTRGCSLQEPLKTMIDQNKYKTMDIVGYLKSVLENARPYARMKLMIVGVQGIGKTSLLEELRHEGSGSYKKRPPEHWAKRMGNKNINLRTSTGTVLSTVGVDICDWTYEKRTARGQQSLGPVTFRTWDFGGQREYYATHLYFLSRRSLYLVVWRITDGYKGLANIHQWLINIQARAPNSPVIIVGTHYDVVRERYPATFSDDLQQTIRNRFMNLVDADKCGLPRVVDTIEVSCRGRYNMRLLCNLIYDTVFSLRQPGCKERLLEQKIPATYLALEDVVTSLSAERHSQNCDPVLSGEQYRLLVEREMAAKFGLAFRDQSELNQATAFLHENGVLLHYDDATLKDLYFLDPQWLCDILAHVVTVREINPFARNGVMRMDDMALLFKSSSCVLSDTRSYVVSLLDKFEVAVTWDSRTLLLPSLLPSEEMLRCCGSGADVKIPVRSRVWGSRRRLTPVPHQSGPDDLGSLDSTSIPATNVMPSGCSVTRRCDPAAVVRRLFLMTYFPSGFWSRLMTRLLADDGVADVVRAYFTPPDQVKQDGTLSAVSSFSAEWRCWQTGLELIYADTVVLLRVRELLINLAYSPNYRKTQVMVQQEQQWQQLQLTDTAVLEITLPNQSLVVRRNSATDSDTTASPTIAINSVVLEANPESSAKLMAITNDHIDTLLEDWYPSLGTRFAHTSEGRLLVTRLVPCSQCLLPLISPVCGDITDQDPLGSFSDQSVLAESGGESGSAAALDLLPSSVAAAVEHSDCDSGVGPDSACSSRQPSFQGHQHQGSANDEPIDAAASVASPSSSSATAVSAMAEIADGVTVRPSTVYAFLVEECILLSYTQRHVECPVHGSLLLAQLAPDTVFIDIGERLLVPPNSVKLGPMLGRGAFGFVFRASCRSRRDGRFMEVAMKMLQPSEPSDDCRASAMMAYKAAQNKWERDPLQYACKAYCTVRQEMNILSTLRHPNIVPLVGLCVSPLALVLELAPGGALDTALFNFRRSGVRLTCAVIQTVMLQVAKALEYLHQQRVVYRDLKSENVLVWSLPDPGQLGPGVAALSTGSTRVDVRLADYGISRSTLPAGTKGFAGTEGFMAPEIMKYNGEEEYTEKVDCFSFGMFLYELITLRQPFEGFESIKQQILEGRRPPLSTKDVYVAPYLLDTMVLCWSQQPQLRPSASQLVTLAQAPELSQLRDAIKLHQPLSCHTTTGAQNTPDGDGQVWVARSSGVLDVIGVGGGGQVADYTSWQLPHTVLAAASVGDGLVWLGDSAGTVRVYSCSSCEPVFVYAVEPDRAPGLAVAGVRCISPLANTQRVAVSLTNGRLFLTRSDVIPDGNSRAEGSFVVTELGNLANSIHCLTSVLISDERCELWCGQDSGAVSVYTLEQRVVVAQDVYNHFSQNSPDHPAVLGITSRDFSQAADGSSDFVWTFLQSGCVIYQWSCLSHSLLQQLDCSRLAPVSESLMSIVADNQLTALRCQVSAICVRGDLLFVGTRHGCILVIVASSLTPLTVFRPYEHSVESVISLKVSGRDYIATLGRGYRPLVARHCEVPCDPLDELTSRRGRYLLLWRADSWQTN